MSYILVLLTLSIQGVLLWCVYEKVVLENSDWRAGIWDNMGYGKAGESWYLWKDEATNEKGETATCNDGQSLCTKHNGTFSCAPPSVQLTGRWDELDLNEDGKWTREEVMKARTSLKCKYAVDPVEVFDVFLSLLKSRQHLIWLHPDVQHGRAIYKPYFTYALGDIVMCGYRNQDMCGNLLKRGVFHVPLKYNTSPRVGNTINSALDYCREMLEPRGTCERLLPSTYSTWKIESVVQCKKPKYKQFVYNHPTNGIVKSLLEVDYKARQRYAAAKTPIFKVYKGFIVGIWILLIVAQMRELHKVAIWVYYFPSVDDADEDLEAKRVAARNPRRKGVGSNPTIRGISMRHRVMLCIVCVWRFIVNLLLCYVGVDFLGRQTDYVQLLLDGVALMFIIEVAEVIFARVVREEVRKEWMEDEPMSVTMAGRLHARPDINDMLWLGAVVAFTTVFIWCYSSVVVNPLYDALQCSCINEGGNCVEARKFSSEFWDDYWQHAVPNSYEQIETLRDAEAAGAQTVRALARRAHYHIRSA